MDLDVGLLGGVAAATLGIVSTRPAARRRLDLDGAGLGVAWSIVAGAVVGGLVGAAVGWHMEVPAFVMLAAACLALAEVDAGYRRLPRRLIYPAAAWSLGWLALAVALSNSWTRLLVALAAAACVGLFLLLIALARPGELGMGDVRLSAYLALHLGWFGWSAAFAGLLAGLVAGAATSLVRVIALQDHRTRTFPLGPSLIIGSLLMLIVIAARYR